MHNPITAHSGVTCNACYEYRHIACAGKPCDCLWCACFLDKSMSLKVPILVKPTWYRMRIAAMGMALLFAVALHAQCTLPQTPLVVQTSQCVQLQAQCGSGMQWQLSGVGTVSSSGMYCAPAQYRPQNVARGVQLYPNDNAYNAPINAWPLHPDQYWITRVRQDSPSGSGYHNFKLGPGPRWQQNWPVNVVSASTPTQKVHAHFAWCNGCQDTLMPMAQPPSVEMQSGWSMDPYGATSGGTGPDRHMLQCNQANGQCWEYYQLTPDFHNIVFTPGNPTTVTFETNQIRLLPHPQRVQVNGSQCAAVTNFGGTGVTTYLATVVSQVVGSGGYSWAVTLELPANSSACTAAQFANATLAGSTSNDPLMNAGSLGLDLPGDNSNYGGPDAGGSSLLATSVDPEQWYRSVQAHYADPNCNGCNTAVQHAIRTTLANRLISARALPPATLFAGGGHPNMIITGCTPGTPPVCTSGYNLGTSGLDICDPWAGVPAAPGTCQVHAAFIGLTGSWAALNDNADHINTYCLTASQFSYTIGLPGPNNSCSTPQPLNASGFTGGTWTSAFMVPDFMPYGTRLRLMASYNNNTLCVPTGQPGDPCPYEQAMLNTLKVYGLILLDGTSDADNWDSGILSSGFKPDVLVNAAIALHNFNPMDAYLEVVDPVGTQPNWTPTSYTVPNNQNGMTNYARNTITVRGSAGTASTDVNLLGTAIDTDPEMIAIAAGTSFTPLVFVTGNVNTAATCYLSPAVNGITATEAGTIRVADTVSIEQYTQLICTATADPQAVTYMDVYAIPVSPDHSLRLAAGILEESYVDTTGQTWWGQYVTRQWSGAGGAYELADGIAYGPLYGTWNENPGGWGTTPNSQLYGSSISSRNDVALRIAVANDSYTINACGEAGLGISTTGQSIYDVEIQGAVQASWQDTYALAGGQYRGYCRSYPATVSNGVLNVVWRYRQDLQAADYGGSPVAYVQLTPTSPPPSNAITLSGASISGTTLN